MKVHYTDSASADVTEILDYIKARSPQGALKVRNQIRAIERMLKQFPRSGAPTRYSWLRRVAVTPYPYLIFYEATDTEIIIHAIRHSARRPSTMPDGA